MTMPMFMLDAYLKRVGATMCWFSQHCNSVMVGRWGSVKARLTNDQQTMSCLSYIPWDCMAACMRL